MACCPCDRVSNGEQVTATGALLAPSPIVRTARQYVGGTSGFDSPFDAPSPVLTPVPVATMAMKPDRFPLIIVALVAVIAYLYFQKRR